MDQLQPFRSDAQYRDRLISRQTLRQKLAQEVLAIGALQRTCIQQIEDQDGQLELLRAIEWKVGEPRLGLGVRASSDRG